MSHPYHQNYQYQQYQQYHPHHPTYNHGLATGHHALHAYQVAPSSHPPALPMSSVPLPEVRLPSLELEDERPLPPVPFPNKSRALDRHLRWGTWRPLPKLRDPRPMGPINELFNPATMPARQQLTMVVNLAGQERDVLVRPQGGASVVSVLDVIKAVEVELRRAERRRPAEGAYRYIGESVRREREGPWMWYGLAEAKDEYDVWVLYL